MTAWVAYGAAIWAFVFAGLSLYWAIEASLGHSASADIVAHDFVALAERRDPGFVATLWITGFLKLLGGLFALTLVKPWGRIIPATWRSGLAWVGGGGLLLYGGANLIQHALMQAGVVSTPAGLGERAVHWHLLVWDPYWLLGGLLYLAAAHRFRPA